MARGTPCQGYEQHGCCQRCGRPWCVVDGHTTMIGDGSGVFALCEECHAALTPEDRVPFYSALVDSWRRFGGVGKAEEDAITAAVLAEKGER